jgi:uncharacterized protein (TIGR00375 family)
LDVDPPTVKLNIDLHIHSRFSIGVSKDMTVKNLARWAPLKGLQMIGCGDCLHRAWFDEVTGLKEVDEGTYELERIRFLLTCEVEDSSRVHHLLLFPTKSSVEEFRAKVDRHCKNLGKDGRPRLHLNGMDIAQHAVDAGALFGPAHAFTPWTAIYAAHDSLASCYGDLAKEVTFVELGLSADTDYADRISELHRLTFITNSDAHGPKPNRIAREFVRFDTKANTASEVIMALRREKGRGPVLNVGVPPDLGKYNESACIRCYTHYTLSEATLSRWKCKKCGKRIKKGVWDRVNELADLAEPRHPDHRPPYLHIIPLAEIIAQALDQGVNTKKVTKEWTKLIEIFGDEVNVLVDAPISDVIDIAQPDVGRAIEAFRAGKVIVYPGGGGEYGKVAIPRPGEKLPPPRPKVPGKAKGGQITLKDFE